ncbi:hypothetical protein [Inquilinus limosus]|uniref:Uncharacterized protein n=1 Tax=Inquilinus limosus MP06 TaxID=1398085 RepID=A0A0A0D3W7_9PROT|nr:hypothetical protein [Inquilinus limosus]KGM32799.1 hypothetical protein P409_19305 [Inquilinus limosus MP06]
MKDRTLILLAFLWGVAEASLFFVVPDVPVSLIALARGGRAGLRAAVAAAAGAMVGGTGLAIFASHAPQAAIALVDAVPAISPAMIARLQGMMAGADSAAGLAGVLILASLSGIPYKIAAASAPGLGVPLWELALLTPLVRLPRFVALAGAGALLHRLTPAMPRWMQPLRVRLLLATLGWSAFYVSYWMQVGG